jgi:DNA-binding transcriptional regulator YiaG
MALTCDHCGSIIGDKDYITVPFDLTDDKLGNSSADDWFYYCERECSEAVRTLLENLRRAGHEGEVAGLQWGLVETPGTPGVPRTAEGEEVPAKPREPAVEPTVKIVLDGDRLRSLRLKRLLSQEKLGEAIGLKSSMQAKVSTWETGRKQPTAGELESLSEFFDIPVALLAKESGKVTV